MATTVRYPQPSLLPFTDFETVTPDTRLSDLNLNWRERDLPERVRTKHVHRLHPYLGKFVPQLVEIFLRKYQPQTVCDPFCGSGTTLVEALALGVDSFGSDISEFNCLLSRVKTDQYDLDELEWEIEDILGRAFSPPQLRLTEEKVPYVASDYLRDWFAPKALNELLSYRSFIGNYRNQDLLKIILSRSARSARLTTHFDLDFPKTPTTEPYQCYKHSRICRPTETARQFITRYSHDTLKRVRAFALERQPAHAEVACADSRYVQFPECDLVVTSPPYVGLIDYHEQHRYAYELLGMSWQADQEIGRASKGSSRRAQQDYMEQIKEVFSNVQRSLTKDGRIVVVVHDRRQLYPGLAQELGMTVEAELQRHVDRRTGRRSSEFFESVFVWRAS